MSLGESDNIILPIFFDSNYATQDKTTQNTISTKYTPISYLSAPEKINNKLKNHYIITIYKNQQQLKKLLNPVKNKSKKDTCNVVYQINCCIWQKI